MAQRDALSPGEVNAPRLRGDKWSFPAGVSFKALKNVNDVEHLVKPICELHEEKMENDQSAEVNKG